MVIQETIEGLINTVVFGIKMKLSSLCMKWRENIGSIDLTRAVRLHLLKVNIFNVVNQNNFHIHLPRFK